MSVGSISTLELLTAIFDIFPGVDAVVLAAVAVTGQASMDTVSEAGTTAGDENDDDNDDLTDAVAAMRHS